MSTHRHVFKWDSMFPFLVSWTLIVIVWAFYSLIYDIVFSPFGSAVKTQDI